MSVYSISNANYPSSFFQSITVPVIVDCIAPLKGVFTSVNPPTDLTLSLDEAISLADRHLSIERNRLRKNANPVEFVQDWINILRWEASKFWRVEPANNWFGLDDKGPYVFSHEDPSHSGQFLAECVALKLITRWLRIPRQMMYFLDDTGARPDYVFKHRNYGVGALWQGRRFGLEARWRKSPLPLKSGDARRYLFAQDYKALREKKAKQGRHGLSAIIGVYCFYGIRGGATSAYMPRIHLVDPQFDPLVVDSAETARRLVEYYLGVTSRIGLWEHHDLLLSEEEHLVRGRNGHPKQIPRDRSWPAYYLPPRRGDPELPQNYRGRRFSTLLALKDPEGANDRLIKAMLNVGDYGATIYHGVHETVLEHIASSNWEGLSLFYDQNADNDKLNRPGLHITSDGIMKYEVGKVEPESQEAEYIKNELRL